MEKSLNEKQFLTDVYDVLQCNTEYITQQDFNEKYKDFFVQIDCDKGEITLRDEHHEWRLMLQKVWCDATAAHGE